MVATSWWVKVFDLSGDVRVGVGHLFSWMFFPGIHMGCG